jgi:hypothetical protein
VIRDITQVISENTDVNTVGSIHSPLEQLDRQITQDMDVTSMAVTSKAENSIINSGRSYFTKSAIRLLIPFVI